MNTSIRNRLDRLEARPPRDRVTIGGTEFTARLTCLLEAHRRGDRSVPRGVDRAVEIMETLRSREIEETLL